MFDPAPVLMMSPLSGRSARTRFMAALLLGGSTTFALSRLRYGLRKLQKEQRALADAARPLGASSNAGSTRRALPAVDARFARRLLAILRVCIPGPLSQEAGLVLLQGLLLGARTIISDRIAALEGTCAENVTALNWPGFRYCVAAFALNAIPASVVNSALKAMQLALSLAFRKRLTTYLHRLYMTHRAYYSASALGGLEHADQRLTDDVEKFCETISELYSRTLKPLFDLVVFSRSLSRIIGYKGQAVLYMYFVVIGAFLRRVSPPLARMTAQYSSLSGAFRAAHSRVSASAEEVAFHDPPAGRAEMRSLNLRLDNMIRHSRLTAVQRFLQQCLDGYLVKYTASIIGLTVHAAPLYYTPPINTGTNVLAGQYINSMRLMMQSSSAMGELVLVYKRVHSLAGHTARVSELIEQVRELGKPQGHLHAFRRVQDRFRRSDDEEKQGSLANGSPAKPGLLGNNPADSISALAAISPATRKCGPSIQLERVSMWSPEGTMLVRDLDVNVPQGTSVIILGPNGSGKSSILRMLAGLWPLQAGTVALPPREDLFFLAQRSYMYSGSLAEQLMYPNLPGVVVGEFVTFDKCLAEDVLRKVELSGLISRCGGFDGALAWDETLSGGERNRLAVARLLYHRPKYAILDEVTAAVSADGEVVLYRALSEAGITLLSVAHRKAVMQFHQAAIVLDGDGHWEFKALDNSPPKKSESDKVDC